MPNLIFLAVFAVKGMAYLARLPLETRGVAATAVVTRKHHRTRGGIEREVQVRFTTRDGQEVQAVEPVEASSYRSLGLGHEVRVRYLPDAPHTCELLDHPRPEIGLRGWICLLFSLGGASIPALIWCHERPRDRDRSEP